VEKMQANRIPSKIEQVPLHRENSRKFLQVQSVLSNNAVNNTNSTINPVDKYLFHKYILTALPKNEVVEKIDQ
jgi:hypothetical protein